MLGRQQGGPATVMKSTSTTVEHIYFVSPYSGKSDLHVSAVEGPESSVSGFRRFLIARPDDAINQGIVTFPLLLRWSLTLSR